MMKPQVPVHYQLRNRKWHIDADQMDELIDSEFDHLSPEKMDVLKDKGIKLWQDIYDEP